MAYGPKQRGCLLESPGDWQHQRITVQMPIVSGFGVLEEKLSCPLPHALRLFEGAV